MRLAVIPARGGSKRIPRKNIKPFCGKPIIGWSIKAAQDSGCFDKIIVSTDDQEIAHISRDFGAEVPFKRPAKLSDDFATTAAVIAHAVRAMRDFGNDPQEVCCIYATAPFVTPEDLRVTLQHLIDDARDFAFPVTRFPFHIERALRLSPKGAVGMFFPEHELTRSQELEDAFHDAGQFYWGRAEAWVEERSIYSDRAFGLVLPRHRVQDIDTPEDWEHAERLFRALPHD